MLLDIGWNQWNEVNILASFEQAIMKKKTSEQFSCFSKQLKILVRLAGRSPGKIVQLRKKSNTTNNM